jgi:hypothetical protein
VVGPNPGPSWQIVGPGDFTGDSVSDILWQNTNGQLAIWFMNGTTLTSSSVVSYDPGPSWRAVAAADFNGDGLADVL